MMRPLNKSYDGLKMLEFHLFPLKVRSIVVLLTSLLRKTSEITLFLISPYFHTSYLTKVASK